MMFSIGETISKNMAKIDAATNRTLYKMFLKGIIILGFIPFVGLIIHESIHILLAAKNGYMFTAIRMEFPSVAVYFDFPLDMSLNLLFMIGFSGALFESVLYAIIAMRERAFAILLPINLAYGIGEGLYASNILGVDVLYIFGPLEIVATLVISIYLMFKWLE